MALSSKDALTTLLAAATAGIIYVQAKGVDVAVVSSPRLAGAALLFLGIGMCVMGADPSISVKSAWSTGMAAVGAISALAAVGAILTGNKQLVLISAAVICVMWVIATGRRAFFA